MKATEVQWLRYISNTLLQIEPVLVKFDDDARERNGASRSQILSHYTPFSQAAAEGLDGLIITGDNLELIGPTGYRALLPFAQIRYGPQLGEVIDYAQSNIFSTIYSCLASHFALNYRHHLERDTLGKKIFGVYEHQVDTKSVFTDGMDDIMNAPHSRWGNILPEALRQVGIDVLAESAEVGWLLAGETNLAGGRDLYIQGHPEYGRDDLKNEYDRDAARGQSVPAGYYPHSDPAQRPVLSWANDARALHANWIGLLYQQFS
jgi:homoserine O-succinyltransferase